MILTDTVIAFAFDSAIDMTDTFLQSKNNDLLKIRKEMENLVSPKDYAIEDTFFHFKISTRTDDPCPTLCHYTYWKLQIYMSWKRKSKDTMP